MDYNQFWAWMEFNRLSTFLPEKDDWRNAQLLSKLHNVNTTEASHLTSPKDFMPRSIDEIIEDEIAKEEVESNRETAIHNFNSHVSHLKLIGKPVKDQTVKVD